MLSPYGKTEWLTIILVGLLISISAALVAPWWVVLLTTLLTLGLVSFFRDPKRQPPSDRAVALAPADGRVTSVHQLDQFTPLEGPATCIRIFLSVFDVHINRCPCHSRVGSISFQPGDHRNALKSDSAQTNESNLIVLVHPIRREPVAAVRQIAGALARTIVCAIEEGQIVQRGQRIGMIKLGSTTELYLPSNSVTQVRVEVGQKVKAGTTVLAQLNTPQEDEYTEEERAMD